jgi:hypothetical protein
MSWSPVGRDVVDALGAPFVTAISHVRISWFRPQLSGPRVVIAVRRCDRRQWWMAPHHHRPISGGSGGGGGGHPSGPS